MLRTGAMATRRNRSTKLNKTNAPGEKPRGVDRNEEVPEPRPAHHTMNVPPSTPARNPA